MNTGRAAVLTGAALTGVLIAGAAGYLIADQQAEQREDTLSAELADLQSAADENDDAATAARTEAEDWKGMYEDIVAQVDQIEADLQEDRDTIIQARDRLLKRETQLDRREAELRRQEVIEAKSHFPGDGTFIVGKDVTPGTYRSAGSTGCYYAFMSGLGATADIIDNNLTDGPTVVSLAPGDVFETSNCSEWDRT